MQRMSRYNTRAVETDTEEFRRNYRLSKELFDVLVENVTPYMKKPTRRSDISIKCKNDEIKECVEQILQGADLEKITMKMVYTQVYSHYPDFDLTQKKDFIRATIASIVKLEPTMAQMEKLVKFLEENPDIATGTDQTNNAWEAIAKELNLMGGANRSGSCWANIWYGLRSRLNQIIADRKSATGAHSGIIQPYTPEMMERMIILLEVPGNEEIPAEAPSTINLEPTMAQMEKLVKFLEENPDIATRRNQVNNPYKSLQTTQKWEAIAKELNLMGGANRSGDSWSDLWDVSRNHFNHIIAARKCTAGARGVIIHKYTPEMMERMITLLGGLAIDETPAEYPSDEEIKNYVKQILEFADLKQITMRIVCEMVFSHYADFDLKHKRDFIKATVMSCI